MASESNVRSWQVSAKVLRTPTLALGMVLVVLGVAELVARTSAARNALLVPSVGSSSRRFELQLFGLDRYVNSIGTLDCLVLGNSTALMGVDPDALAQRYRSATGQALRCYNFGVDGMTASAAGALAPLLVHRYHPRLLIYIVSARDVGQSVDGPRIAADQWVQYQAGSFAPAGALATHFAAFRYYLLYRQWLDPVRWPAAKSPSGTTAAGFFASGRRLPLSPALFSRTQELYTRIARRPLSPEELAGFSRLVDVASVVPVVVVEAPAHEQLRRWVRHTTPFYNHAIAAIRAAARQRRVPFWRAPSRRIIPSDAWVDFVHLDQAGATRFSEWIATRVARAVREGRLALQGTPA